MNLFSGQNGNQGNGKPTFTAWAAGWLATCIALFSAIFVTPDMWSHFEPSIREAIYGRYSGNWARFFFWLTNMAAYPLVFFGTQTLLGAGAIGSFLTTIITFGRRPR
ncbi:MAG: hypothetical protein AAFQ05_01035 [Pseudomonadota bacterium]